MVAKGDFMALYTKATITDENRKNIQDALSLTGAEISIFSLSLGEIGPIIPHTKGYVEVYAVLRGRGEITIENREKISLSEGEWIRISPRAIRQISAARYSDVKYLLIRLKA